MKKSKATKNLKASKKEKKANHCSTVGIRSPISDARQVVDLVRVLLEQTVALSQNSSETKCVDLKTKLKINLAIRGVGLDKIQKAEGFVDEGGESRDGKAAHFVSVTSSTSLLHLVLSTWRYLSEREIALEMRLSCLIAPRVSAVQETLCAHLSIMCSW